MMANSSGSSMMIEPNSSGFGASRRLALLCGGAVIAASLGDVRGDRKPAAKRALPERSDWVIRLSVFERHYCIDRIAVAIAIVPKENSVPVIVSNPGAVAEYACSRDGHPIGSDLE